MIEPYYNHDGITIYHADCREVLPRLPRIDLVVTDPPYGINYQSHHRHTIYPKIRGDDKLPTSVIAQLIGLATRAVYVFCRWDVLKHLPEPRSVVAWIKNNWSMGDLAHEHGRQWEACCFYPTSGHEFIKRTPDVIHANRTGNNLHPTEKPVDLITELIGANVGSVVLDPFMGSGTTLVAAKQLGRKAIGIEIEEKYCEIAVERLKQGVLDLQQTI
jgi:site-specific DNA-methyltransferase (adenine-specific)